MPSKPYSFTERIWSRISPRQMRRVDRAVKQSEALDTRAAWVRLAIVEKLERDELMQA